jgi:Holliday junction resolvasome RuvABC endonuclease subunit
MIDVWSGNDPGLANFGIAHLVKEDSGLWRAIEVKTVKTSAKQPMHERLFTIWEETGGPSEWVLDQSDARFHYVFESQAGARRGHEERGTTNEHVALVERAIGVAWSHAYATGGTDDPIAPIEVTPSFVRNCLGLGQTATKAQVEAVVRRIVRNLPVKMTSHAADAVAIALAGERRFALDKAMDRLLAKKKPR